MRKDDEITEFTNKREHRSRLVKENYERLRKLKKERPEACVDTVDFIQERRYNDVGEFYDND